MKVCSKCNDQKSLDQFNRNKSRKDGLQTFCRDCEKIRGKEYRKTGAYLESTRRANQRARERRLEFIAQFLLTHPCVDCGNDDIVVLDFDHLDNKEFNIMTMVRDSKPLSLIQLEIEKCEVVCRNCHAHRTYSRLEKCWRFQYSRFPSS